MSKHRLSFLLAFLLLPAVAFSQVSQKTSGSGGTNGIGADGTGTSTAADDTVPVSDGSNWAAKAVPNCTDTGGNHLNYTIATNAFSCGTSGGAGGGAPADATYITQTLNGTLSAEQAIGALASGGLFGTTTTGVILSRVLTGTASEISIADGDGIAAAPTFSLPATIDLGGKTSFEMPNAAAPTVDAFGEIAGDNDLWGAGRGAPVFFDGTAAVGLVGALVSDVPSNGQVPTWNTGGTVTWEDAGAGGGANTALSNLASVAINTALLPDAAAADDFGSATLPFKDLFFAGSSGTPGTNNFQITGASTSGTRVITAPDASTKIPIAAQTITFAGPTAARTYTFPDAAATIARTDAAQTFSGLNILSVSLLLTDNNSGINLGTANTAANGILFKSTATTPDSSMFGAGTTSNSLNFVERGDIAFDFNNCSAATSAATNPTFCIHSNVQNTTGWVDFKHDATDGVIATGLGALKVSSASGMILSTGSAPTVSSCGTTPSTVTGSNTAGRLTTGSGGTVQSCTLTFVPALAAAPSCVANDETAIVLLRATATTTTLVIDSAVAGTMESDVINYICLGGS